MENGDAWVHIECNRYRQLTSNILMVDDAILTFKEKISEIIVMEG